MKTFGPALGAALLSACLLAPPAQAQRRDEQVGNIGNVTIVRVFEGGRFDRCYGMVPGLGGGARLFWSSGRDYALTVPGVGMGEDLNVAISTPAGMISARGRPVGERTAITLNGQQAQRFMSLRRGFEVDVQGTIFPYVLQGVTMEQVFVAVEGCVFRNQ